MRKLTVLSICIALVLGLSFTSSSIASDEDEALKTMENWYKAFSTSDFELMASLWWHSEKLTQFGPGATGAFLNQGWEIIGADWKSGLDVPPGTEMPTMHNPQVTMLGNNVAIVTSYNVHTYTDPVTKVQTIGHVRGTFVMQKIDGKWLIVHEHSSMLPTE